MSEENTNGQEPENKGNDDGAGDGTEFKVDDLPPEAQRIIRDLRKENAKHRTDKNATKAELDEYKAWKDSQKSELQKAQDRAAELERELNSSKLTTRQIAAAKKAGLDLDLADRVRGDSDDEMLEDAKSLALLFGGDNKGASGGGRQAAGTQGKGAVGTGTKSTSGGWFDEFMKG